MFERDAKRVGIWIRVSTEDQARGESPEHHEKRARLYAEAKGWQVIEVYHLEAVSGKSVMEHPETQRMLGDARDGRISGLIFSKLARLARNTRELLEFAEIFEKYHADLISLQEAIDTSTPAGRLFYTIIAAMAQWEREEIAERVKASVPIRAKLGKPLGGQAPFGYRWIDKRLVPDPQETPIRQRIYELFLEHRRKKTVARLLNETGYRTRTGAKFSDTTVGRLLEDPIAKGLRRANYTQSLGTGARWELKPEEEWVYSEVEPIIAEELWDRCNQILESQRAARKPPARKTVHLFAGLVFCACGSKMYVPSNSPKYTCAKCRNKIGVDDLAEVFQEQLKSFLFSPTEIRNYLDQADQHVKHRTDLLEALVAEERKIKQDMDKVYDLYIGDQISREGFAERYRPLEERLGQIGDEIVSIQSEIDFLRIQYLSSDEIIGEAQDLHARWSQLEAPEKRQIIDNVLESISVGAEDISINLWQLPSVPEMTATGQRNPSVVEYPRADAITNAELLALKCDVLIPAALEGVLHSANAALVQARILAEGANGPTTPEADAILLDKGVFILPDILANAGGVTVSYFEWVQGLQRFFWSEQEVNSQLRRIMISGFHEVLHIADTKKVDNRTAALILAIDRVQRATVLRGFYP